MNRKMKFSKLFFFLREKKKIETARVELCFALKRKKKKTNVLLTALTKCLQILEKVFSDYVEGNTAMQVSAVDVFFSHGCFFIFALLSFPGRCVS